MTDTPRPRAKPPQAPVTGGSPTLAPSPQPSRGLTTAEVARRYRVSEDKVRGWIVRGELRAINTNTAGYGKPRYVVPPEALIEFERKRNAAPQPKPVRAPRKTYARDYFPD